MVEIKIDEVVPITPPAAEIVAGAQNLARHPDGSLWLNTSTTHPGLLRSSDSGRTWTAVPVHLPEVPSGQYQAGISIARAGRLRLCLQLAPAGPR